MAQATMDLQQLKGIGKVLAGRLKVAGIGSYDGIVAAGADGLKKIPGINPRAIPSILDQAKEFSEIKKSAKDERAEAMKTRVGAVREQVTRLADSTRERFREELEGKCGKKLAGDLDRIVNALDRMDDAALKRIKRAGRGLDKAGKRVTGLEEAGLKKVRKGLKKARKALLKALA